MELRASRRLHVDAGQYTLRGGYGIFNDWDDANTYEQTLRVNGVTQQDLVVQNPVYPDTTGGAFSNPLPPSKYQAAFGLQMPYLHQASVSVERTFIETLRLMASYTMMRGRDHVPSRQHQRADHRRLGSALARTDVWQRQSARVHRKNPSGSADAQRQLREAGEALLLGRKLPARAIEQLQRQRVCAAGQQLRSARRVGPSMQDVRHRFFGMVNFGVPWAMRLGIFTQGQSASPYNVITGFDNNRDTVVNDRPAGETRNSARGSASWNLNARLSKSFGFGPQRQTDGRPRIRQMGGGGRGPGGPGGGGGGPMMMMMDGSNQRYRLEFYLQAFNMLESCELHELRRQHARGQLRPAGGGAAGAADRIGHELRVLTARCRALATKLVHWFDY